MDTMPRELAEWGAGDTIEEQKLAALDVVPLCIKIVNYSQPPRNIWANRTYLQLSSTSLEAFRAQVRAFLPRIQLTYCYGSLPVPGAADSALCVDRAGLCGEYHASHDAFLVQLVFAPGVAEKHRTSIEGLAFVRDA